MVKIVNPLGDVKIGKQGEVVYQRKYGQQIRRMVAPKRAMASQRQLAHRQLYRAALAWRSQLSLANRRYLEGYCLANWVVDSYKIPLPWSRFALKIYLQAVKFVPDLQKTELPPTASEKKESHYGSHLAGLAFFPPYWQAQTFDASESYPIKSVKLLLYRTLLPGTLTCSLRLTDGAGKPIGGDLASGTTNGNTLPTSAPGEWREIELTPYQLTQGERYAICIRAPSGSGTKKGNWSATRDAPRYAYGESYYSDDSGSNWIFNNYDNNFEVWSAEQAGETTKEGILHVRHPALLAITHTRDGIAKNGYDTLSSLDKEYLTGQVGLDVEAGDLILATTLPGIEYPYEVV